MKAYIEKYLNYLKKKKGRTSNTLTAYQQDLFRFADFLKKQGINQPERITTTSCNSFLLSLEAEGKSPASVQRKLVCIRGFLDYLLRKGYIKEDPTEFVPSIHLVLKEAEALTKEQQKKVLSMPNRSILKGKRDYAILRLLAVEGLRPSELTALRISELSLKHRHLVAHGENKERNIRISEETAQAIDIYLAERNKDTDIVFLSRAGKEISRQSVWKIVRMYGEKSGLKNVNPQQIRIKVNG